MKKINIFAITCALFLFMTLALAHIFPFSNGAAPVPAPAAISEAATSTEKEAAPETPGAQQKRVISAESFISEAVDASGTITILAEKNPDAELPIASISKLMTAIVVADNYDLKDIITIPESVTSTPTSTGELAAGEIFFVGDLLHALLIESNNDAGDAFAAKMGVEKFVALMNQNALRFGMNRTNYVNPTGLDPDDGGATNYSTVRDLTQIALAIKKDYPGILEIMSLKEYELKTASGAIHHALLTTDQLLGENIPFTIIGGKTGQTDRAKKNLLLITTGLTKNTYLIHIVLGSDDSFGDMKMLLELVRNNYRT